MPDEVRPHRQHAGGLDVERERPMRSDLPDELVEHPPEW